MKTTLKKLIDKWESDKASIPKEHAAIASIYELFINEAKLYLSAEKEKELWKDSIIVFDTSALIDFYYYPKETREEIFTKIFPKFKDRLWIPYHVQFEYLKNRKGIIEKPITESYKPIKEEKLKELILAKTKILKISEQIKKDTLKPEKHPFCLKRK